MRRRRLSVLALGTLTLALWGVAGGITGCDRHEPAAEEEAAHPRAMAGDASQERSNPPGATLPDEAEEAIVRPATLAGSWYPASAAELRESVASYLDHVEDPSAIDAMALIAPHAGHRWSGQTAAYAYQAVRNHSYRRVFILAPSHRVYLEGAAVPEATAFATPLGEVPVDTEVTRALARQPGIAMDSAPHASEHAVEIQLPFLQVALHAGFRIVPIVIGEIDVAGANALADALRPFVGPDDLVIVSSDFTHYGPSYHYVPFTTDVADSIRMLDMGAFDAIKTLSPATFAEYRQATGITVCGFRPIMVLMALLPSQAEMTLLHYDTSGRQTQDYENSVSYLAVAITGPGWPEEEAHRTEELAPGEGGPVLLDSDEQREALELARTTLEQFVRYGRVPNPDASGIDLDGVFGQDLGVFVTLKSSGQLRGCIGNIWPVEPLARAIVGRTVDAAAHDPRFAPVAAHELAHIDVEISVLTTPEHVSSYNDIILGRHGIVLSRDNRRAVYLPQVAPEQGWTLGETLSHLSRKAGLPTDAWRHGAQFEVFEAQVFGELQH